MNRLIQKLVILLFVTLSTSGIVLAQKNTKRGADVQMQRCGTDEAMQRQYQTDPAYRAMVDQREREFQAWKATNRNNLNDLYRTSLLTGPVVIPTVVHIVLPNPEVVTDADVNFVINKLNQDFAGLNADSGNAVAFYPVRGHSLIRFCLAKRDPSGNATTGIERKVGTTQIAGGEPQPLKNAATATGGFNPWDVTKYYNIWVGGNATGLLGIAPAIGVGTAASDGVCVNFNGFSANPCHDQAPFNGGRTLTHEIGHNFGLFHTFQGGCADGDNGQITSPSCQFPASILSLADQTPALSGATSGCPVGAAAAGCATSPNPPGKQYQNYMDYTDDACYSMFTKTQVERMHWLTENCRAGYLTSDGCIPPVSAPTLDAAIINFVSPGGSVSTNIAGSCLISYPLPTCAGPVTPRVMVENKGTATITSLNISFTGPAGTTTGTYAVNIPYGTRSVVVLNNVTAVVGANNYTATVTGVNAGSDAVATNNSATLSYSVAASTPLPRVADFVATTMPPAGFTINNPDGGTTFVRNANGNVNAGSAFIDCYNYLTQNQIDEIRSSVGSFNPATTTNVDLKFDVAHMPFSASATSNFLDTLSVWYSTDCGTTWVFSGYKKWGATLKTEPGTNSTAAYTTPTTWRSETVSVNAPAAIAAGQIQFAIRATNRYGNNIFIDNINIAVPVDRDAALNAILKPNNAECGTTFTPQVEVKNFGLQAITSYSVSYTLDGGAASTPVVVTTPIPVNGTAIVTLPVINTTVGAHTFIATVSAVSSASGSGDQNATNNSFTRAFTVRALSFAPVMEGFENTTFPTPGWVVNNPTGTFTWVRNATNGGFGQSNASMFIDNYNNATVGQIDELVSVPVYTVGADSVIVTFDVAHKNFAGFNDSLLVLVSYDCGATFQRTSYAKGGAGLATAGASTANYTATVAADWRKERVAIGGPLVASSGSVLIAIRDRNGYGNNIFVDNINIGLVYRRDLMSIGAGRPGDLECSGSFTPSITVRNAGLDTVKSFTASYSLNGGAAVSTNISGLNLASGATQTFSLTPITGAPSGVNNIMMYTSNLVTNGGIGDQFRINDTTRKQFSVLPTVAAPLVQDFEGTFPPTGFGVINNDANLTWTAAAVGYNSSKSATLQNYNYSNAAGTTRNDELVTPNVSFSNVDSVFLSFDLAATTKTYPGSTFFSLDTLQVIVSKDCGVTFTEVFKKWGEDLQTISDPNYSNSLSFVPNDAANWKNIKLNITAATGTSSTGFVVMFRNKSNNDNNVYIDNINLNTVTVPASIKQRGYAISPSPFNTSFNVIHYLPPTDLRFVEVFDASGRLVYRKQYTVGSASSNEKIDISREAAGVYTVKIGYTNKVISERIIKTN